MTSSSQLMRPQSGSDEQAGVKVLSVKTLRKKFIINVRTETSELLDLI